MSLSTMGKRQNREPEKITTTKIDGVIHIVKGDAAEGSEEE